MALSVFRRNGSPPAPALAQALRARDAERLRRYRELLDFYAGQHFPKERRGRTHLVANYARAVVDKGVSYLFGRGVRISVPEQWPGDRGQGSGGPLSPNPQPPTPTDAERLLNQLAEENELEIVLLQAATNAAVLGDAFLKVFWQAPARPTPLPLRQERESGRARVVNVDPLQVFPTWASDDPSALRQVALVGRLTADEARERYGVPGPTSKVQSAAGPSTLDSGSGTLDLVEVWTPTTFRLVVGGATVREGPNPYGFIPIVHVANLQPPNTPWGASDLVDVIPLNRELDARMSDQADVIRYHADPPVVFRGVEEHSDLPVGPGTVWDLPRDADVALLEWRGSGPAVEEHLERVLRALYDVAETPRTSFGDSGRLLSGVALETELQPLLQRTLRKRVGWTAALRRTNALLLRLAERFTPGLAPGAFAPYRTEVVWPPMLPRDDAAEARRNLALVEGGLRSRQQAMAALGELDPASELARIRDEGG